MKLGYKVKVEVDILTALSVVGDSERTPAEARRPAHVTRVVVRPPVRGAHGTPVERTLGWT